MHQPAITLDVLPAGFGDSLLVSCPTGTSTWRMLVDTGPDETYPTLRARLLRLPKAADGRRHIDLFVVSHIDHDHIGGAKLLLNDADLRLSFGDIWFNAPPPPRVRGVAEGQSLAEVLGAGEALLPWNVAWSGGPVSTPAEGGSVEVAPLGLPRITVLSPTPERLGDLYRVWAKELDRLRRKQRDSPDATQPVLRGQLPSIAALAASRTATDKAVPNGSSIAMLVEHQGASVLLCADAFSTVLVPALEALARRRGVDGPLPIDAVKLSHHGSRANVTSALLRLIQSRHFVFSTNNAYFGHPNAEAVARVIVGAAAPTLWFNYDTPQNRRWAAPELIAAHGHAVCFPEQPGAGVTLKLPRGDSASPESARP